VVAGAALVSLSAIDPVTLLEAADFPPEQIESFGWMGLTNRSVLLAATVLSGAALITGLLRTRKHFAGMATRGGAVI
jgi:hypothetical protein